MEMQMLSSAQRRSRSSEKGRHLHSVHTTPTAMECFHRRIPYASWRLQVFRRLFRLSTDSNGSTTSPYREYSTSNSPRQQNTLDDNEPSFRPSQLLPQSLKPNYTLHPPYPRRHDQQLRLPIPRLPLSPRQTTTRRSRSRFRHRLGRRAGKRVGAESWLCFGHGAQRYVYVFTCGTWELEFDGPYAGGYHGGFG